MKRAARLASNMKLKFFATYREITRCTETDDFAAPDVWSLLELLGEKYGAAMKKKLFTPDGCDVGFDAIILVNGRNIAHLSGKNTQLADNDTVSIFPLVAGG